MAQFHEEIQIQAAAAAVYTKFSDLSAWHMWYPDVLGANWIEGSAWEENARFAVQVKNFLGMTAKGLSVVRLSSADQMLVWENSMLGLQVVATARFEKSIGGCKFSISKSTHGLLSPIMPLLSGRQNEQLRTGMENLKALIEGDLSRK